MRTYIALLRGVNVVGKNLLPMKELIVMLEKIGLQNVKTYIQSGNVVFKSALMPPELSKTIATEIKKRFGFEPYIIILSLDALEKVMAKNPYPEAESNPQSLHLGFLGSAPKKPDLIKLNSLKKESEKYVITNRAFYLFAPEGVGKSKLSANAERILGVPMTDRNWRTVCKLRDMAKE